MPLLLLLLVSSCKDDDEPSVSKEFFNDGDHVLYYECKGDKINFLIDVLNDTTDGTTGTFPDNDTYRIYVDYNSNGTVDASVDLLIGNISDNSVCVAYFTSGVSTTGCAPADGLSHTRAFSSTENSSEDHTNFRISVPKNLLSDGSSTNVYIQVYDPVTGWLSFPSDAPLFDSFFEISW